jgi:hypothetical protein
MNNLFNFFGEAQREINTDDYKQNTGGEVLNHLWNNAFRYKYHQSFSPERRANQLVREYSGILTKELAEIETAALKYSKTSEEIDAIKTRYQQKFEKLLTAYWNSESNCISAMITGPSNFPVRQQEKRRGWAENKYTEFVEWRNRAKQAIIKSFKPKATVETELQRYQKELAQLESKHEQMKEGNKRIKEAHKTGEDLTAYLIENFGVAPHMVEWTMKFGFYLTNSNANIKRVRERIAIMEKKQENIEKGEANEIEFEGGRLVFNHEADRIQIFFNARPSREELNAWKEKGLNSFNWSPSQNAWQRKITANAIYATKKMLKLS